MEIRNFVMLGGNMGADPKVNETRNGKVARFSLATTEFYYENGNQSRRTDWHNVVAWGIVADKVAEKCAKGSRVVVVGKLTSRSYEDANKVKRYVTEVVASDVFCEKMSTETVESI